MKKVFITIISILLAISVIATIIGIVEKNNIEKEKIKQEEKKKLVTYEYYLEDELQEEMPVNNEESEVKYIFSKYSCSNSLTGDFDTNLWKFTPNEDRESLCKLYFVKSQYNIIIKANNGVVSEHNDGQFLIPRESNGVFAIKPNEGYKYKSVSCTNENKATFDAKKNVLTVDSVMEDMTCTVDFEIKKFKVTVYVKNGSGNTSETIKYGNTLTTIVKANDGYEKPKFYCNNGQDYSYSINTFKVNKVTDNTSCTVTFQKIPDVYYNLKINSLPSTVKIVSGSKSQQVKKGNIGSFTLKSIDGHTINVSCNVTPSKSTNDNNETTYKFLNVTSNITCNVS